MSQEPTEIIRILIADDIPETRENLSKLLIFEQDMEIVGTASNGRKAIEEAQRLQPHIVLMDINMPDMDGITASQEISRVAPACSVIMMSVQSEADYLRRSMLAGAVDYLTKPFTSEELTSSIHRVYEMGASRRLTAAQPAEPAGTPVKPSPDDRADSRQMGKLLLVYSPKGGTGCSTVAVNLAIALQQTLSEKVVLVDGNLQFGDIDVLLNLQGKHSIADATQQVGELDSVLLGAILAPHSSGIRVLTAPPSPEVAETIDPQDIKALLEFLLGEISFVVMDTPSYLDDTVLAAMDLADRLIIVATPEIPSIKSTKQFFEIAEALRIPDSDVDLILNKAIPRDGIRPDQIEKSIKHKILAQLDFDPVSMRKATNQGLPILLAEPRHPISQALLTIAQNELALLQPGQKQEELQEAKTPEEASKRRTGLFGRLKR